MRMSHNGFPPKATKWRNNIAWGANPRLAILTESALKGREEATHHGGAKKIGLFVGEIPGI